MFIDLARRGLLIAYMIGIRRISVSIQFYQYLFGVIDFYFYFTSGNIKTLILYVIIR